MAFSVPDNIHWCAIDSRTVVLDLRKDRYFCLAGPSSTAFRRLAFAQPLGDEDVPIVRELATQGLADVRAARTVEVLPPALTPPLRSLIEEPPPPLHLAPLTSAIVHHLVAGFSLRRRPLWKIMGALQRRKARLCEKARHEAIREIVQAYRWANRVASGNNRCLQRSTAMMSSLLNRGCTADFVIGVKLNPFAAHCWVQHEDRVLTDRTSYVQTYTPLLVI